MAVKKQKTIISGKYAKRINVAAIPANTLGKISGKPAAFFNPERIEDIQVLLDIACGEKKVTFNNRLIDEKTIHIYQYMELVAEYGKAVEIINRTVDYELRPKGRYIIKKLMDELLARDLTAIKTPALTKSIKEISQALKEIEVKESIGMELEIESVEDVEGIKKRIFHIFSTDPSLRDRMEKFIFQNINKKEQDSEGNGTN